MKNVSPKAAVSAAAAATTTILSVRTVYNIMFDIKSFVYICVTISKHIIMHWILLINFRTIKIGVHRLYISVTNQTTYLLIKHNQKPTKLTTKIIIIVVVLLFFVIYIHSYILYYASDICRVFFTEKKETIWPRWFVGYLILAFGNTKKTD